MEKQDNTSAVLQTVHATAQMGKSTLGQLLAQSDDADFSAVIRKQQQTYAETAQRAARMLSERGEQPQRQPVTDALSTLGLRLGTMMDSSPAHMARMMIEGSAMGITALRQELDHGEPEESAARMARNLVSFEEKSIETLKKYL